MNSQTLIFDIGKTNKKLLVFDKDYQIVYQESQQFQEIADEDGFPCDDLFSITNWIKGRFQFLLTHPDFEISKVNFSTYGASWVHINEAGQPVTPLFNYLKPFPETLKKDLNEKYGLEQLCEETASPYSGMLNSAFQLFWLKQQRAEQFSRIESSLHFPQYLSYLFTGQMVSEYTSIGCHTGLWDFQKNTYHSWVKAERIDQKQAVLLGAQQAISTEIEGKHVGFGIGIHDSSASLLPYLRAIKEPFILLSTGTWSVALNPFSVFKSGLTDQSLHYMKIDGNPVKAARLFLGNEYSLQVNSISEHFDVSSDFFLEAKFQHDLYTKALQTSRDCFSFESLPNKTMAEEHWRHFQKPEEAYHQLVFELVQLQKETLLKVSTDSELTKVFIDGGFAKNEVFVKTLAKEMIGFKFFTSKAGVGTALGAALVIDQRPFSEDAFRQIFDVQEVIVE